MRSLGFDGFCGVCALSGRLTASGEGGLLGACDGGIEPPPPAGGFAPPRACGPSPAGYLRHKDGEDGGFGQVSGRIRRGGRGCAEAPECVEGAQVGAWRRRVLAVSLAGVADYRRNSRGRRYGVAHRRCGGRVRSVTLCGVWGHDPKLDGFDDGRTATAGVWRQREPGDLARLVRGPKPRLAGFKAVAQGFVYHCTQLA